MKNRNNAKAIELVIFKPKPGLSKQEVKSSMVPLTKILTSHKGFVSRTLAATENNLWMDLVLWETMADAKTAAKNIMKQEEALQAFQVIDENEMKMYHFEPVSQFKEEELNNMQ